MSATYTPGLRVTASALLRRERRLPLKGEVLVSAGQGVEAGTVVARTDLPGNVQTVNLASRLSLDPARVESALTKRVGESVRKGETLAESKSLFGLVKNSVAAPADGVIESASHVTGQLILREPPIPVEVNAYVRGVVVEVLPGEGVVVETHGAFLQGIFGVGGEACGPVKIAVDDPGTDLTPDRITGEHRGAVVVGGAKISFDAIARARDVGAAAIVAGGLDDADLKRLLGRDLGVAITGSEDLGVTVIVTEGFGRIPMAARAWKLLRGCEGRDASVSGATQIRAGVMRPELVIPDPATSAPSGETDAIPGLAIGAQLRVIREPYFGRIGTVVALPAELQPLETEAHVRVLVVEFADGGGRVVVPRANVELISS